MMASLPRRRPLRHSRSRQSQSRPLLLMVACCAATFLAATTVTLFLPTEDPSCHSRFGVVQGFTLPAASGNKLTLSSFLNMATSPTSSPTSPFLPPASDVWVLPTEAEVTEAVHSIVREAAELAIAERGHFAMAIPGGSVLKILSSMVVLLGGDDGSDWPSKMTLAYVNHKCVPNDDVDRAIHAKARKMFLDRWGVPISNVITLMDVGDMGDNGTTTTTTKKMSATDVAADYEARLKALPESILPRDPSTGLPVFDLMLIGVGDDGHVGSLYPGQPHVDVNDASWTVGVEKEDGSPGGVSLTLPVMCAAKLAVVAAAGQSDKYPKGKAAAMRRAVQGPDETPNTFPACGLRSSAIWILDKPNASELTQGEVGDSGLSFRTDKNYRERRTTTTTTTTPASSSTST